MSNTHSTKPFDLQSQSTTFETATPEQIMRWAVEFYGPKLCMQTSFQLGGMVLIDMLAKIDKTVPIFFIDTTFHFRETLEFCDQVREHYKINLVVLKPGIDRATLIKIYGDDRLYERNNNECCRVNKVEPMERALKPYGACIAALRRDGGSLERAKMQILDQRIDGLVRIHPLANWSREQTKAYLQEHHVPTHPLHERGYKTIGCAPECCTKPVGENAPERAGRWTGTGKTECGLHLVGVRRPAQDFSI